MCWEKHSTYTLQPQNTSPETALATWAMGQLGMINQTPAQVVDGTDCWWPGYATSAGASKQAPHYSAHKWHQATCYKHPRQNKPGKKGSQDSMCGKSYL